jgi:hypothetical protein
MLVRSTFGIESLRKLRPERKCSFTDDLWYSKSQTEEIERTGLWEGNGKNTGTSQDGEYVHGSNSTSK